MLFRSDPVPTDYKEEIMLEGLLLVGEPLQDVRILKTLPVTDTFSFERASLSDAKITVLANGVNIPMEFVPDSRGGTYRAVDTSYRVQAKTVYAVTVQANGSTLTASTLTPASFAWTTPPKTFIRFPFQDSLLTAVNDSLLVTWSPVQGTELYIIGLTCLVTIEIGRAHV